MPPRPPVSASPAFLEGLNEAQKTAVCLGDEPALILAGAGSGKTRVLISRIAYLLSEQRARPHQILAVTFTNKAAREMRERLSAFLGTSPPGLWMGTFHGLCHRFLRFHATEAGLPPDFQIMDQADQRAFIARLLKESEKTDSQRDTPAALQRFINSQKETGTPPEDVTARNDEEEARRVFYALYEARCQREGRVDFAELLLRCFRLFVNYPDVCAHYRHRFRHVLVDEFQDTNQLQYTWLKTLVGPASAPDSSLLFCVGDDDQSIYRFRGAHVGNMYDFRDEYQVQALIRLEQNYRSHGHILEAANALIQHNPGRLGKHLWTQAPKGPLLEWVVAHDEIDEARRIVKRFQAYRAQGLPLSDMAVLYRANAQSQAIEHQLFAAGLPYRVYGGLRFFDRQEIRHALAYLRLLAAPHDDAAFLRVVNFPPRGIGARTLDTLTAQARAASRSLYEQARQGHGTGRPAAALSGFVTQMDAVRTAAADADLPACLLQVLEASTLLTHYKTDEQGEERLANLNQLVNAARAFNLEQALMHDEVEGENPAGPPLTPLAAFLAHAALEAGEHDVGEGDQRIQLMTVHAAKGLEFEVVWVAGMEDGLFPHQNSLWEEAGLEEERRLMYVAITRAKRHLHLSLTRQRYVYGEKTRTTPSRFLEEIPESLFSKPLLELTAPSPPPAAPALFAAKTPPHSPSTDEGFALGQAVFHDVLGEGVVMGFQGGGQAREILIQFRRDQRQRWLSLALVRARLTPLPSP